MFILILRKKETFDHIVWSLCIMNSSPRLKNMACRDPGSNSEAVGSEDRRRSQSWTRMSDVSYQSSLFGIA